MRKFTGVFSAWLLCAVTSLGALAPEAAAMDAAPARSGAAKLVIPERGGVAPGDLVAKPEGPQAIACDHIDGVGSWCTCQGESSTDCDQLFGVCDEVGALWYCSSDFGGDEDYCTCVE